MELIYLTFAAFLIWIAITCPKCGRPFFRHNQIPPHAQKTILRIFHDGDVIIGPITLHELASMARYGNFDKESSILYLGHYISPDGFDVSIEYHKE